MFAFGKDRLQQITRSVLPDRENRDLTEESFQSNSIWEHEQHIFKPEDREILQAGREFHVPAIGLPLTIFQNRFATAPFWFVKMFRLSERVHKFHQTN